MSTNVSEPAATEDNESANASKPSQNADHKSLLESHDDIVISSTKPIRIRRKRLKIFVSEPKCEGPSKHDDNHNSLPDSNLQQEPNTPADPSALKDGDKVASLEVSDKSRASNLASTRMVQCEWQDSTGHVCRRSMQESKLANHIRWYHLELLKRKNDENSSLKGNGLRCVTCGKYYMSKYTFEQHVRTHSESPPTCDECGSTFSTDYSLARHRAKFHRVPHNFTEHKCDKCNEMFFSLSELALHQQRHSDERTIECPECKKRFSTKGNLNTHMRVHSKEKNYRCDLCTSMFTHPYSLVIHRRSHTRVRPFECEQCGKEFVSKHQLASHSNVHKEENPYPCDRCSKTFRSRTAFKGHQDWHDGIKRFSCTSCERKFTCQANLVKHQRRHLGVKKHKCELCPKAFIEPQELRNHLKVHDKQKGKELAKAVVNVRAAKKKDEEGAKKRAKTDS